MAIPVSASIEQLNAEVFLQEGFELSLDAIVPSIELTGSFTPNKSKTQFYIYNYSQTILYQNLNYESNGTYLPPENQSLSTDSNDVYNQFELNPIEDIYNQGYSSGNYYALYNFIDYELGSELIPNEQNEKLFEGYPYFIKDISGDRTELRIQNNFLNKGQIENYYQQFSNKINARENADEFYVSFENNRNFIAVNSQLELPVTGSTSEATILIKLYNPLPLEFEENQELQIITKVGETQVFNVNFQPNLEFIDNLLSLKGPNYNVSIKDKVNNSTNFKTLKDLINTNSSASYYQFNSLKDQKGVVIRKNWGDWSQFVKYSSAEQRLNNFKDKLTSIEAFEDEILDLEGIDGDTTGSVDYSSSYNDISNNINQIISKFDSYEYFLYYVTGSESWPKYTSTYPYKNFSVSSSEAKNWFGSTNESDAYFNTGKNQIFSASIYDNNNQDYLYYLIPPFITDNSSNNQYIKFVNMTGQAFDEAYIYTEALEQVRNTNSSLTGSVLPLGLAADVVESLGFTLGGNDFNSIGFNPNGVGVFPSAGSGLEYISRYVDIASGSVINYYDQKQSTLGYVIALADPSFPYPIENSSQEIYKRIFHNMVSLVKRKGTVTGLRQLINIWGVPNTMLRISEFGGKNKDDENDYDLWMNRYSTAIKTYSGSLVKNTPSTLGTQASSSVLIPWTPLTSNFYDPEYLAIPDFSLPDSIQFRFRNKKPIGPDQFFTSSLLIKPWFDGVGGNVPNSPGAFAIVLEYSGSNSGSFDGSTLPTDSQYGTLQLVMSGSVGDGAIEGTLNSGRHYFTSSKISLPFFNDGWWSVQLQRMNHLTASTDDNSLNEFELRVANNIYDGYDGNQIGFQGSASIQMIGNKISSSMNTAWNNMFFDNADSTTTSINKRALLLGGLPFDGDYGSGNNVIVGGGTGALKAIMKVGGKFIGRPFVGEYQEFRYYRRAVSASSFNDYVMNPESIQGHSDSNTGAGSSYDQLSYRISLGNELEFNNSPMGGLYSNFPTGNYGNTKNQFKFGINVAGVDKGIGSIHPSIVNSTGELFTSSFIEYKNALSTRGIVTSSYYSWDIATAPDNQYITASWISPINEINYMDQPAAGLRNRIKNKIQVIDGNEYGTILSPFRSIQQEFEQSGSYTEDINSLEVGFSFQNEINDDIIGTFGHGVVSDAIADPRFISESSDRYPELTRIAEDYFKKYQGFNVNNDVEPNSPTTLVEKEYDYNRLIKFYETSLFKAIKNYVPARTSLSTGIIVKQHLLERNKTNTEIGININTEVATTPETGSNTFGPSSQTGFNSRIVEKNLLVTSSIGMYSLTGSAGGSVNKYNIITNEGQFFKNEGDNLTLNNGVLTALYPDLPPASAAQNIKIFTDVDYENKVYVQSEVAFRSQLRFNGLFTGTPSSAVNIKFEATSSKRGGIFDTTFSNITVADPPGLVSDNYMEIYPDERIYWNIMASGATVTLTAYIVNFGEADEFTKPEPSASQQVNWYIDDFTGEWKVDDHQTEFYDGEFSGSNFEVIPPQYNPYRIFADGNDKTSDTSGSLIQIDITQAESDANFASRTTTGFTIGPNASPSSGMITGSVFPHNSNFPLKVGSRYTISFTTTGVVSGGRAGIGVYSLGDTGLLVATGNDIVTGDALFKQNTDSSAPSVGINGTFSFTFVYQGKDLVTSNGPGVNGSGILPTYGAIVPFYICPGAADEVVMSNITLIEESLGEKHFFPNDGFTIQPSQSQLFQNSPYNPIINNVSGSRKNSYLFDMDFDPVTSGSTKIEGIPSDYSLLVSASQLGWDGTATNDNLLEFAEVPDSNYTSLAVSNPRYKGSKVTSADYNFRINEINLSESQEPSGIFSPLLEPGLVQSSKLRFLDNETGSWKGDKTGNQFSAIDNRPISFAHFKTSYESLEIDGSTTFEIDYLIEVPRVSIQNEQAPIVTGSILTANNENLIPVGSTFKPNRKLKAIYNQSSKQFKNFKFFKTPSISTKTSPILNFGAEKPESKYILFPAQEVISEFTNQKSFNTVSLTQSFICPQWLEGTSINHGKGVGDVGNKWVVRSTRNGGADDTENFNISESIVPFPSMSNSASLALAITGSSPVGDRDGYGLLYLQGYAVDGPQMIKYKGNPNLANVVLPIQGPHLQVINSINHNINNGSIADTESPNYNDSDANQNAMWAPSEAGSTFPVQVGVINSGFVGTAINQISPPIPEFPTLAKKGNKGQGNYFTYDYSGSALTEYQNQNLPIIIERGDEIKVTYATVIGPTLNSQDDINGQGSYKYNTVVFKVLGYEMPPPMMVVEGGAAWPLNSNGNAPWFPENSWPGVAYSNEFYCILNDLPEKGVFSPDEVARRYNIIAHNTQSIYGIDGNINSDVDKRWSGSVISATVETRVNTFSGSSDTFSTTGSVRLHLTGSRIMNTFGAASVAVALSTTQQTLRATNYGNVQSNNHPYDDTVDQYDYLMPSRFSYVGDSDTGALPQDPGFIFDTLKVTPNPSTLETPIFSGSIMSLSIIKRFDNDMRVVVDMDQPRGSKGILTPSGDGYLIPDDLTAIQQDNVIKLINVLKSQNSFTNPPDTNESQDVGTAEA